MENVDSGWEMKEWVCDVPYAYPGEGCGWKGLGSECRIGECFEALVEYCCPNCGNNIIAVEFPLVGSGTETYTWGKHRSK